MRGFTGDLYCVLSEKKGLLKAAANFHQGFVQIMYTSHFTNNIQDTSWLGEQDMHLSITQSAKKRVSN